MLGVVNQRVGIAVHTSDNAHKVQERKLPDQLWTQDRDRAVGEERVSIIVMKMDAPQILLF